MAALNPKIEQNLFAALKDLQQSSSLSPEDMERVSHFAVRLITEYSLLKSEEEEGPNTPAAGSNGVSDSSKTPHQPL